MDKTFPPRALVGPGGTATERLRVATRERRQVIDVTRQVDTVVRASGVKEGIALVHCPHTTAAVVVNERDPPLMMDLLEAAGQLVREGVWRHDPGEGNGAAHLRSMLLDRGGALPVEGGALALGTWQSVLLVELDGPRERELWVQVVGL